MATVTTRTTSLNDNAKIKRLKQQTKGLIVDKSAGSMYNSWRAKVYTRKGKLAGFDARWEYFKNFQEDMQEGWKKGRILLRKDTTKPYTKDNCFWGENGEENNGKLIMFGYNGKIQTLLEWSIELRQNYNGMRQRYFRGKNYTPEEVLFGKTIAKTRRIVKDINLCNTEQKKCDKVSKMLSSYRCKDKKRGLETTLTNDELRSIIENGKCIYCGDTYNIGLDRIDNSKGHTLDNVVPCCYECNVARGNNFTHEEMLIIGKAIAKIKQNRKKNNEVLYNLRVMR